MKTITRRAFVAAATVGAVGALAGCSSEDQSGAQEGQDGPFDVLNEYLPLGSIVTLKGSEEYDVRFMIVSRRPNVASIDNGDGSRSELGYVYDYAGVQWPLGFITDLSQQAQGAECLGFNREDVARIDFLGCQDGREEEAKGLLNDAYGTMDSCETVLLPMQQDIVSKFPEPDGDVGDDL